MTGTHVHTIADIARLAGVSKSTVSRALNDSPLISDETKERIRALAEEHEFELNAPARQLSLRQSHTIAFITYAYKTSAPMPDAFMLEIMSGISTGLHEHGYDLLVVQIGPNDTDWVGRYLRSGRADGFILLSATCSPRHLRTLVEQEAPFVIWDVAPRTHRNYCSVSGDSVTGGRLATEHLLNAGRRRIGFLGGPAHAPEVRDRLSGYEAALREAGVEVDPSLVVHADWANPETTGALAIRQLLERAPDVDAVFANSDLLAIAAMDELREHGRRVPGDVAVVGYDDVSIARYSNPPLTTIRQNGPLAGRLLAQNLVQRLESGAITNVAIPAELVVRESA
jgi:DNA-binding LacI/PurR family transcriptional regulator